MVRRVGMRHGAMTALAAVALLLAAGSQAQAAGAAPAVRWSTFVDPSEHSFSMDVPAGWQVVGGARRMTALEVRTGVTLRSPDGAMELFVGDNGIPIFQMPNPMLSSMGFREGSTYSPGYGQTFIVGAYQPGRNFAANWGRQRVAAVCPAAAVQGSQPAPTVTRAIDGLNAQYGIASAIEAGEATFACSWKGAAGAGYVFAATERMSSGGNGIWGVKVLAGYAARADRAGEAAALLAHVVASFKLDEAWAARNSQTGAAVSRIVAGTNAAVSRSIIEAGETRQASQDRISQARSQATRGTATFVDPVEGRRELENAEHQWRLPNGAVVSSRSASPPMPGAVELQRAPR